jgi:group II intron reverse transcriptase/maturase
MSLTPPLKVGKLQAALHDKAKRAPGYRFYSLYDKIYREEVLRWAWDRCRKNGGAPGVDGQSFEQIEKAGVAAWLGALADELREKTYRPQAVRRVMIPKSDGKTRPLGIPTIRDRVAQMAAVIVLEPIFEADFPDEQYGYRPGRSAHDAIRAIHGKLKAGYTEVVDAGLSGYFDTIPHHELMKSLARRISDGAMLALLKMWLEMPVETTDECGHKQRTTENKDNGKGTPQGAPISPLLSNLYMRRFVQAWKKTKQGLGHLVVYADDFVILCRSRADEAREEMEKLMGRLKLKVNEKKTRIARVPEESFDFLGYTLGRCHRLDGSHYIGTQPSRKSIRAFCAQLSEITRRSSQWMPVETMVEQLNSRLKGWGNYFCLGPVSRAYGKVDDHARHRLRQWLKGKHRSQGNRLPRHPAAYLHHKLGLVELTKRTRDFPWAKA